MFCVENAFMMASGAGERMMPLTKYLPKPLLPVGDRSLMEQTITQVNETAGTADFFVKCRYHAGLIQETVGFGTKFGEGVNINYIVEDKPYHTAEGVKRIVQAQKFPVAAERPFWVLSGDILTPKTDYGKIALAHLEAFKKHGVLGTVAFKLLPLDSVVDRFGVAVVNEDNLVEGFKEKPASAAEAEQIFEQINNSTIRQMSKEAGQSLLPVNASIYLLNGNFFEAVAEPPHPVGYWDFGTHVFPGMPPRQILAYFLEEEWSDVGCPEDLWRAQWYFLKVAESSMPDHFIRNWQKIGDGSRPDNFTLENSENVVYGNNVEVRNCRLKNVIISEGCILANVEATDTLFLPYTYVNVRSAPRIRVIRDSIVGGNYLGGAFVDGKSLRDVREIDKKVVVVGPGDKAVVTKLSI